MGSEILLEALRGAAKSALTYLRSGRCSSRVVGRGSFGDVTKAFDKEAEERATLALRRRLRNFLLVTEEAGVVRFGDPAELEWVVIMDPVDGSTNFDAGIPWTSVVLAGARWREGGVRVQDIEAAVIAEVFRDLTYEYSVEGGVKVNGVAPKRRDAPAKVLLGYFDTPEAYSVVPHYWKVRGRRAALRSLGSASLDVVSVALGRAEAFVDARAKLRNVDVAASLKILLELGGDGVACLDNSLLVNVGEIFIDRMVRLKCLAVGYDRLRCSQIVKAVRAALNL